MIFLIGLAVVIASGLGLMASSALRERRRLDRKRYRRRRDAALSKAWSSVFGHGRVRRLSDRSARADGDGAI